MTAQLDSAVFRLRLTELTFQLVLGWAQLQRFVGPLLVRNLLPDPRPVVMVGHVLRHFDAPVPVQHGLVDRHRGMQDVCHGSYGSSSESVLVTPVVPGAARFTSSSSSFRRSTLPTKVFGNSARNSTCLGTLNFASRCRQCSRSSVAVADTPSFSTTKASIFSPRRSWGMPTTQASLTFGCPQRHSSTSRGYTFMPPDLIISFLRSRMKKNPSLSIRTMSPVESQPSRST